MIALASDYLLFKLPSGATVPFSTKDITFEVEGDTAASFDSEFIRHAADAVFHFFRYELQREVISVAEFAAALEKVLSGFKSSAPGVQKSGAQEGVLESDLGRLAEESGKDSDLFFFSILRAELRRSKPR